MKYFLKTLKMKNKGIIKNFLFIPMFTFFMCAVLSGETAEVVFDADFFKDFNSRQIIQRDEYFDSLANKIVSGRGKITAISVSERYKKKYRIIIESSDSTVYNQKIIFFVFLENKDKINQLSLNSNFEFKGQLMGYTPLGTKRNEYILDIVFMDGSTIIE